MLVAEDNPTNRMVIRAMLSRLGLEITDAGNGQQAVDMYRADHHVKLVLMDIQMPVLDGYDATRAMREIEQSSGRKRVPVLALTANAFSEDRQNAFDSGMDDYLTKPVQLEVLSALLEKWLPD